MADTSHDIRTLNGLIATTVDSIDGYTEAAKDADGTRFADMFNSNAGDRRGVVSKLQAEVARLGGNPEDDGTTLAAAHRGFLGLKAAVTGKDDKAIVDEVERGEDHIKHKFEAALNDTELAPETRTAIEGCYQTVKRGHDQVRDLKHAMEGAA